MAGDRGDDTGWTMDKLPEGRTTIRTRVDLNGIDSIPGDVRVVLAKAAAERGMTLREYVGWVARMLRPEISAYRRRTVEAGDIDLYRALQSARMAVTEVQTLVSRPGEPQVWI